jgi:hypothetical protein
MKALKLVLLLTLISILNCTAQQLNESKKVERMVLEYSDGNGNYYKISENCIVYKPITMAMSSSGTYDGSPPAEKEITLQDLETLRQQFEEIFKNKEIQIKFRMKTSGKLTVIKENGEKKSVIIKRSEEQKKLESALKGLLK